MNKTKKAIFIGIGIGLLIVAAWIGFLAFFVARSYEFEYSEDGRMSFGVCKFRKDAFCIGPEWDGGEMSFEVPDEFMGFPVTALGGYTGRGYPCPFAVRANAVEADFTCGDGFFDAHHRADDEYEIFRFSVRLGKNVRALEYVDGKSYLGNNLENDEIDFLYKIVYSFTVDEGNGTFYAESGKLYYKANRELVSEFFYE